MPRLHGHEGPRGIEQTCTKSGQRAVSCARTRCTQARTAQQLAGQERAAAACQVKAAKQPACGIVWHPAFHELQRMSGSSIQHLKPRWRTRAGNGCAAIVRPC